MFLDVHVGRPRARSRRKRRFWREGLSGIPPIPQSLIQCLVLSRHWTSILIFNLLFVDFIFGHMWLAGSQFHDKGLNPGYVSEIPELNHQTPGNSLKISKLFWNNCSLIRSCKNSTDCPMDLFPSFLNADIHRTTVQYQNQETDIGIRAKNG